MLLYTGHIPGNYWMQNRRFSHDVQLTFDEKTGEGEVVVAPDHRFQVHPRTEEPSYVRYLEVLGMEEVFPRAGIRGSLVLCEKGQAWWSPKDRVSYICDTLD